jgi:PAS domain S-box-containing protein
MAATLRQRVSEWRMPPLAEATQTAEGRRRVVLYMYAVAAPIGIFATALLHEGSDWQAAVVKAVALAAVLAWAWLRASMSMAEWVVLLVVVPAVATASSAWIAGTQGDDAFVVAMVAITCIVAAIAERQIVIATALAQLAAFSVVQIHVQPGADAATTIVVAACWLALGGTVVMMIATNLRRSQAVQRAALSEAERLREEYQTLVEQMPAVICRFDVNRREMLYASPQVERLTGEPQSVWLGREGYARWSGSMIGASQPDWEQLGRRNIAWQNQYQWRRADGAVRWFRSITRIVAPGIVQSIVLDATEDVETEQRLALQERRYQALIEQMPMVTMRADGNGVVEYVSPQVESLLGMSREQFMASVNSERWLEMIHPADRAKVAEFVDLNRDAGTAVHELELRVRTQSGEYLDVLMRRARVDAPEAPSGRYFHSVAIDISDLRRAEERSRAALDKLVRASEEEQARLAIELHDDTVQVMIAVLLQLQRVQSELPALTSATQMLEGAIDRTRRLMFEIRPAVLERDGLAAMIARIARDGPWDTSQVDIAIGRQSETVEALCYRTLRELIVNARKHSGATRLRVTGSEVGDDLMFVVEDDGAGFEPEEELAAAGLHIGLSSVVERLRLAGGDVQIQSRPGRGTRVRVTLPSEPRPQAGAPAA